MAFEFLKNIKTPSFLKPLAGEYLFQREEEIQQAPADLVLPKPIWKEVPSDSGDVFVRDRTESFNLATTETGETKLEKVLRPVALTGLGLIDIPLEAIDFLGDSMITILKNATLVEEELLAKVSYGQTKEETEKRKQKWLNFWGEVKETNLIGRADEAFDELQKNPALQPSRGWQEASLEEKLTNRLPETVLELGPGIISSMGQFALNPSFGLTVVAGSTANDVKDIAVEHGVSEGKAELLGASTGILVSWLEKLVPSKIFGESGMKNQFVGSFAKRLTETAILETGTEITQEIVQMIAEETFRDIGFDEALTRIAMSGLSGLVGGIGAQTVTSFANDVQRGEILQSIKEAPIGLTIKEVGEGPTVPPKTGELEAERRAEAAEKTEADKLTKAITGQKIEIQAFAGIKDGKDSGFRSPIKDIARAYGDIKEGELRSIGDVLENPFVAESQYGALEELGAKDLIAELQAETAKTGKLPPDLPLVQKVDAFIKKGLQELGYDSVIYTQAEPEYAVFDVSKSKVEPAEIKPIVETIKPKDEFEQFLEKEFSKVEKTEIESLIEQAESEIIQEFQTAEAGERILIREGLEQPTGVLGKPSSFPDWMPEGTKNTPTLKKVLNHLLEGTIPPEKFTRQRELYKAATKEILNRAGLTNEQIGAVMKYAAPTEIKEAITEKQPKVPEFKEAKEDAAKITKERKEIEKTLPRKWLSPREVAVKIRSAKEKGKTIGRVEARKEILEQLRVKGDQIKNIKKQITEYVKANLPTSQRGKALVMVRDAKTQKDLTKAFIRVDGWADDFVKKSIRKDIFKIYKRVINSPSVAIDYKKRIKDLMNTVELRGHTGKTTNKLKQIKKFLDDAKTRGEQVELPERVLKSLEILSRKPFNQISLDELENMRTELNLLEQLGRTKLKTIQSLYESEKEIIKKEIISETKSIDKIPEVTAVVGEELTKTDKIRNLLRKSLNEFRRIDKVILPMDVIFDMLDGAKGTYSGANTRLIKGKLDYKFGNYLTVRNNLEKSVLDIIEKTKITEKQLDKIGFYAAKVQENGVEKLVALGYSEDYIKEFDLTEAEMKVYTEMRKVLDKLRPEIATLMKDVYNQPVGKVENYFSFLTDWDAMSESEVFQRVGDKSDELGKPTKQTEKGFTKKRTDIKGVQKIRLDALGIFRKHIDNAAYLIEMSRDIKMIYEIINSQEYGETAGDTGQLLALEWIDLMARKGGSMGAKQVRILDMLRKNMGMATLGFKISSTLIQPTSLLNGAGYIGRWAFAGAKDIATNKQWREFVVKFPEIEARVGDDPAFLDFQGKISRVAFWGLQKLDKWAASSIAAGAYKQKISEMGERVDFDNINKEAMEYAQWVVRKSQASMFFKDLPLAVSRGSFTGNKSVDKAIFQFQTFVLNNWATIRYDIAELGIRAETTKERLGAANKLLWLLISSAAATGIRMGANRIVNFISGEEDKEDEDFKKKMMWDLSGNIPFLGQTISVLLYGGQLIPSLEFARTANKAAMRLKSKTPPTRKKGIINLFETLGQLLGVPGTAQISDILEGGIEEAPAGGAGSLKSPSLKMPSLKMKSLKMPEL